MATYKTTCARIMQTSSHSNILAKFKWVHLQWGPQMQMGPYTCNLCQLASPKFELKDFVGAKIYYHHASIDSNQHIWIMKKMLEFSSTVLPAPSLYHYLLLHSIIHNENSIYCSIKFHSASTDAPIGTEYIKRWVQKQQLQSKLIITEQTKVNIEAAQGCGSKFLPAFVGVQLLTKSPRFLKPEYQQAMLQSTLNRCRLSYYAQIYLQHAQQLNT